MIAKQLPSETGQEWVEFEELRRLAPLLADLPHDDLACDVSRVEFDAWQRQKLAPGE